MQVSQPLCEPSGEEREENEPPFKQCLLRACSLSVLCANPAGELPALLTCSSPLMNIMLVRLFLVDLWVPATGSCL